MRSLWRREIVCHWKWQLGIRRLSQAIASPRNIVCMRGRDSVVFVFAAIGEVPDDDPVVSPNGS